MIRSFEKLSVAAALSRPHALSADGSVCIFRLSGTDLILDVAGWID